MWSGLFFDAKGLLTHLEQPFSFGSIFRADHDRGGSADGIKGRHIFIADIDPQTCTLQDGFCDLGLGQGVVLRQYNKLVALHNVEF